MASQVLFNPLPYIDRLTRGGFTPEQARAQAEALESALSESVATKRDLTDVKNELKTEFRVELANSKNEMVRWMLVFNIGLLGAIIAIAKLFFH